MAEENPAAEDGELEYSRADWRGIPKERLERHRALLVQRGVWVRVQFSADGRLMVSVEEDAKTGVWVLGPEFDYRLEPGSRVRLQQDGSFFAGSGDREMKPAIKGRPSGETVWP